MLHIIQSPAQLEDFLLSCVDTDKFFYEGQKYEVVGKQKWIDKNQREFKTYLCSQSILQVLHDRIITKLPTKLAVCGIIELGNRIVCVKRKDQESYGLIGGKVDLGETIYEAIIRESLEETGYNLQILFKDGVYIQEDASGYVTYCFKLGLKDNHQEPAQGEVKFLYLLTKQMLLENSPFTDYNIKALNFFDID